MRNGIHILLCEDNEEVIMITEYYLKSKSFDVSVVRTAEEAMEFLNKEMPSLLLLDLNLPQMGGERLVHALKSDPATSAIPVIIISADSKAEEIAMRIKAEGCIKKPYDLDLLVEKIYAVAGRQGA